MRITTIVGARPQFVKASMVSRALAAVHKIEETVIHTGQHYDNTMSDVFFAELDIPAPTANLGIGSGTHGSQTGKMLEAIERVLLERPTDWVLVYGDTNSTIAGALAAAKLQLPLAHVEAGLRSFNRQMPEEINRVLTDHASDLLFAPTDLAVRNLLSEGIGTYKIKQVGDVMYDSALYYGSRADQESTILERLELQSKNYILTTVHRAENTNCEARLRAILTGLRDAPVGLPVVFPIHPRTRKVIAAQTGFSNSLDKIKLIDPVGYLDMVTLEKNARAIVTDSGGVQKEAFFFSVPCVTVRTETEWQELIDLGWNRLARPDDPDALGEALQLALVEIPRRGTSPYGDGHASERIARCLLDSHSKACESHEYSSVASRTRTF